MIGAVLSGYIVLEAVRAEVPTFTLARMLVNVGIDTLVGSIPALGDVFDAAWKSNMMNVALLERHLVAAGDAPPKRRNVVGVMALALIDIGQGVERRIHRALLPSWEVAHLIANDVVIAGRGL